MRGRLVDFSIGYNRKNRITIELDYDFRNLYDELNGVELEITIKKHRERRSLDANAYAWVLIDKIAEATGATKEAVYRSCIKQIGGVSEPVCVRDFAVEKLIDSWQRHGLGWQADVTESKIKGCKNVILYYGSSTYDTKQMSSLIDLLVQDAKQLGIETLTPEELQRIESGWQ